MPTANRRMSWKTCWASITLTRPITICSFFPSTYKLGEKMQCSINYSTLLLALSPAFRAALGTIPQETFAPILHTPSRLLASINTANFYQTLHSNQKFNRQPLCLAKWLVLSTFYTEAIFSLIWLPSQFADWLSQQKQQALGKKLMAKVIVIYEKLFTRIDAVVYDPVLHPASALKKNTHTD